MAVEIDYRRSSKTPQLNYPGIAQLGRAPALGAGCRMFKSCYLDQYYSSVVQSVERRTVNPYVTGSSPVRGAIFFYYGGLVKLADTKDLGSFGI